MGGVFMCSCVVRLGLLLNFFFVFTVLISSCGGLSVSIKPNFIPTSLKGNNDNVVLVV